MEDHHLCHCCKLKEHHWEWRLHIFITAAYSQMANDWWENRQGVFLRVSLEITTDNDSDWLFGVSLRLRKRVWWEAVKDFPDFGGGCYVLAIVILSPLPLGRESPALVNEVTWSSGVSLVNILHPEWVSTSTKIRKWALSSLSRVPLKCEDQPLSRALEFINYLSHDMQSHVILPATMMGNIVIIPTWQVKKPRPRGVAWVFKVSQSWESQGGAQIMKGKSACFITLPQTNASAS